MNAFRLPKSTPAAEFLLCLGFVSLGAAVGLFATGTWAWGVVALLVAAIVLAALTEAVRKSGALWGECSPRLVAAGRAQAATGATVWRARLEASLTRWRANSRLDGLELEKVGGYRALGEAIWRDDALAEREARSLLERLEEERKQVHDELDSRLADAEERIRVARLPVQATLVAQRFSRRRSGSSR